MSLRYAILGVLEAQPRHGYELKAEFDRSISHFWPVNLAAIYPNLRRLEDEGQLVSRKQGGPEGRPDRKVYEITEAGRETLARWRRLPPEGSPQLKDPFLLNLFFAKTENLPDSVHWIEKRLEGLRGELDAFQQDNQKTKSPNLFTRYMAASAVAHGELRIEMLEELAERLKEKLRAGEALE